MTDPLPLDLTRLREAYATGSLGPRQLLEQLLPRLVASDGTAVWITRVAEADLLARAEELERLQPAARGPLWGVPFAVKDNIDVAGLPTTAACPAFAYTPASSAEVVRRLLEAGAILVGKTNLDQFATGLVGVRSPYGVPANPFDPAFIPGGSSSGSAVAVATGLASFALGTDTAGSGRVPAAFNNIVGLKPTKGLIPTTGVVPACRSLDCVSIFALTAADAAAVLEVAGGFEPADPFSRRGRQAPLKGLRGVSVAIPQAGQLRFFGDEAAAALYARALAEAEALGAKLVEVDLQPCLDAAELLYAGPWLAERHAAVGEFIEAHPDAAWPTTRSIIDGARRFSATDAFKASYKMAELVRAAEAIWQVADLLLVPTAPTIYRTAELAAEPVLLNSRLGTYTNFVNLMDLAGIALPGGFRKDGLPLGVTFLAPAWHDRRLAAIGQAWQRMTRLTLGATGLSLPAEADMATPSGEEVTLAVVGAHLSGEPLNHELCALGGRLLETTRTATAYRLYALPGTEPPKPGLVRATGEPGGGIEVELWALPMAGFGRLVAAVPPPLAIGSVELEDSRRVKGFICEAHATRGAKDITGFGGWRAFRRSLG